MVEIGTAGTARYDAQGLLRWVSNDRLVPIDVFQREGTPEEYDLGAHQEAITRETAAFLGQYVAMRKRHGYSAEERAEALRHIGPDAIDVITGERLNPKPKEGTN